MECPARKSRWVFRRLPVVPSERRVPMLVLSRKKNESIIINDDIKVTIVEIRGDKVRLGIEAPKEIPIHRSEIHAAIQTEEQKAAQKDSNTVPSAEA